MLGLTNKKIVKKIINVLTFLFYHTIYLQSWDKDQDRYTEKYLYRYRYMDIDIGSGAESGGADGAESSGAVGADRADHNKK